MTKFYFEIPNKLGKLVFASSLFVVSLGIGLVGFIVLEGYTFINAFYMTVITFATVGFTEVQPLSDNGRIFTAIYIIFNLGVFAVIISTITSYLVEGELVNVLNIYRLSRKVRKLKDHVIVCGFGRNGSRACEEFIKLHLPFVVIENDNQKIAEVQMLSKKINILEGDATHDTILKTAGVERAKALITALPKDADNVYVTLSARQLNPKIRIIARANEAGSESKLVMAGADKIVRPDIIGGTYMANLVTKPEIVEFLDIISGIGTLKIEEYSFEDFTDEFKNKSIRELDARNRTGVMILGFKDDQQGIIVNPNPGTIIGEGDFVIVLGTRDQIEQFSRTYTSRRD